MEFISNIKVQCTQQMGGDLAIVAAAKVSTIGAEAATEYTEGEGNSSEKRTKAHRGLINYLMEHRHGCYDDETEVLTDEGWKKWPDVKGDETFVTLDLKSNTIELQRAERVVHKQAEGAMIKIRTQSVDILVTADHNMVAAPRTSEDWKYGLYPAREFLSRSHRIRLGGGEWQGELHEPKKAELIGFIVADGNVGTSIEFNLKKERKIEWLESRAILSSSDDGRRRMCQVSDQVREWAKQTYTVDGERCFPREILDRGDAETIKALLDGYLVGDGCVSPTGKITCSTTSRQLVNDIQEAALKAGMSAVETEPDTERKGAFGTKPLYRLTIYSERNDEPRIGWTAEARSREVEAIYDYRGNIHCVTVPNGTLYVRRNGKPCWCGNTPFEHSAITFLVHAPIFVWREWHRHRIGFSYNEESGRYKTLDPVFYIPDRERPMMKVEGWKPGRPKFLRCEDDAVYERLIQNLKQSYAYAYDMYLDNLSLGIDPGLARDCLPVGIYSSCWVTCNPRSLMAFCSLRTHHPEALKVSYPLYEIEIAAEQAEALLKEYWPLTHEAFVKHGRLGA